MAAVILNIFKTIFLLLLFASLLFIVYVTTRVVGGKANKAMKGRYIKVVETISLGMDKRIHLMKIGDKYILVASSAKNLEYLTEVSINENEEIETEADSGNFDFKVFFDSYLKNFKKGKLNKGIIESTSVSNTSNDKDDLVTKNVKRLKSINERIGRLGKGYEVDKPEKR